MKKIISGVLVNILFMSLSTGANAAATVVFEEVGGDVVATASGSLDLGGLSVVGSSAAGAIAYVAADRWIYEIGLSGGSDNYDVAFSPAETLHAAPFGPLAASSSSGGPFGVLRAVSTIQVVVPDGYVSGSAINAISTWSGATFAALNLTVGTYVFDYGQDTITFIVQSSGVGTPITQVSPVPTLPLGWLLASILGVAGTVIWRLRGNGFRAK